MKKESALTIEKVIEYYGNGTVDLSRARKHQERWIMINCPFHDDKKASAGICLEKSGFHCHACDVWGDALNTIARHEGFGTPDRPDRKAAREWAERVFGTSFQNISRPANERPERKPRDAWRDQLLT